jgi:hypothetical protein
MIEFTDRDRDISTDLYRDMADAVAAAVARREASLGVVYIAAYQHRFGLDFTAHATRRSAELAIADIATRECARDPQVRDRVIARYGTWPAQAIPGAIPGGISEGMPEHELDELANDWTAFAHDEALWIAECDVQTEATRDQARAFTRPRSMEADQRMDEPYDAAANNEYDRDPSNFADEDSTMD